MGGRGRTDPGTATGGSRGSGPPGVVGAVAAAGVGLTALSLLALASPLSAQQPTPPPAPWPCQDDDTHREFDFWVGTWDVFVGGRQVGVNVIESMLGGCVLLENWTNARDRGGKSFNWIDRSTFTEPRWRQLWVDDGGNTLDYYDGHFSDGAMRFSGHTFDANGDSIPQKLTFHSVHPDTVRQVFEQSTDGGATWVVTFDGLYVKRR